MGVPLKTERGRRVFPVSDRAGDIRQALLRYAAAADIVYDGAAELLLEPWRRSRRSRRIRAIPGGKHRCVGVKGESGREYRADAVLVATGGKATWARRATAFARQGGSYHRGTCARPRQPRF